MFGAVISGLMKEMEKAGIESKDMMCLSDHTSKWNMDIYVSVDEKVEGAENVVLNGKFLSKVYEGNFKNTDKWCEDYKKYGKNYVVIIDKVKKF